MADTPRIGPDEQAALDALLRRAGSGAAPPTTSDIPALQPMAPPSAPQAPPAPAPQYQAPPAPQYQVPPAPEYQGPPAPQYQAPQYQGSPAPQYQAPQYQGSPAPQYQAAPPPPLPVPPAPGPVPVPMLSRPLPAHELPGLIPRALDPSPHLIKYAAAEPEATITLRARGYVPADTVSINLDSQPYDTCYVLPKRYAPAVAAVGVVAPRRCFQDAASYTLDAWTYGLGCCTLARGSATFQGYLDPQTRAKSPSLTVDVVLAPVAGPPTCNYNAACDPS